MSQKTEIIIVNAFALLQFAVMCVALGAVFLGGVASLVHALRQHNDSFVLHGRLSKTAWVSILAVSTIVSAIFLRWAFMGLQVGSITPLFIASIAGTAVMVYWVGVRPQLNR